MKYFSISLTKNVFTSFNNFTTKLDFHLNSIGKTFPNDPSLLHAEVNVMVHPSNAATR